MKPMSLEEVTLRSSDGSYERATWFRPGPDGPRHLGICLDGEFYLERVSGRDLRQLVP